MRKFGLSIIISISLLTGAILLISSNGNAGDIVIRNIDDKVSNLINVSDNEIQDTVELISSESVKKQVDVRFNGKEKTLYVIKNDIDLRGESIIFPSNVILQFDGGTIYNGTLEGHETQIVSVNNNIIIDVAMKGSWKAKKPKPEWFGAVGDGITDDTYAIKTLAKCSGIVLFDKAKTYLVKDYVFIKSNIEWNLNESTIKLSENRNFSLYISQVENVKIRNGYIIGNKIGDVSNLEYGITIDASKNVTVDNILFSRFSRDGIYVGYEWSDADEELYRTENISITRCFFDSVARNGITVCAGENIEIAHCLFRNIDTTFPKAGIDIEPENVSKTKYLNLNNVRIHDCVFDNCWIAISVYQSNYNYQNGNVFISDVDCINSILYIENIKKNSGFNTQIKNVTFKDCNNSCIQIVNPCNRMHTILSNIYVKTGKTMFKPKGIAAISVFANGNRDDLGGIAINGLNVDDQSYKYMISISHKKDKEPGKLKNISIKNIRRNKDQKGRKIIIAEGNILDKGTFKTSKSIKREIEYLTN